MPTPAPPSARCKSVPLRPSCAKSAATATRSAWRTPASYPGTVLGIDIETTGRAPERGYIINVGWEIMELTSDAVPHDAEAHYCGLPDIYRGEDVPLSNIHHITWDDIDGKEPFRENKELQKQLLKLMKKYPYMAHNAAFEDSWFKIHLDGYAEARRAGKIIVIDSRQICRSLDADVRSLPRESAPAALENWARRRGTLAADANEQHLAWTTPTSCSAPSKPSSTSRTYSPSRNACDKPRRRSRAAPQRETPQRGRPTFHR